MEAFAGTDRQVRHGSDDGTAKNERDKVVVLAVVPIQDASDRQFDDYFEYLNDGGRKADSLDAAAHDLAGDEDCKHWREDTKAGIHKKIAHNQIADDSIYFHTFNYSLNV